MKTAFVAPLIAITLLGGCASPPPAAPRPAAEVLKFSYPSARRVEVEIAQNEREFLLNEMRYYLDMLWVINDAMSRNDLDIVIKAARARVPAMNALPVPQGLENKLPGDFRALWRTNQRLIDELADIAERSRNVPDTLRHASVLLQACNQCHARFQLRVR